MDAFGTLLSCFIQCFKSLSAGWLTGHLAQLLLETAVGSLIDGHYSYCQDEDGIADTLNQIFKKSPNKRKSRNSCYEWEYDDAA